MSFRGLLALSKMSHNIGVASLLRNLIEGKFELALGRLWRSLLTWIRLLVIIIIRLLFIWLMPLNVLEQLRKFIFVID